MSPDRDPGDLRRFRARAEKILKERMERLKDLSTLDLRELVHELGTHQIELEMQNEELRRAQEDLETSRSRYAELYDLAPVGYFTFDTRMHIEEVNLKGAQMLGVPRDLLRNVPFSSFLAEAEDLKAFRAFCKQAFLTGVGQSCELMLKRKDQTVFSVNLQGLAVENTDDHAGRIRVATIDITDRKRLEEERERVILDHMDALSKIKTLTGMLPICMHCKKIRNDEGYWNQLEAYISEHSEAEFSHGVCPECAKKLYPRYFKNDEEK